MIAEALAHLVRAYRQDYRQAAAAAGLTPFAADLLDQAAAMEAPTLGELAASLGLDPSWVSRGVQSLVNRGLLSRVTAPEDRRAVRISLTEEGRRHLAGLLALMDERAERLAALLPASEARAAALEAQAPGTARRRRPDAAPPRLEAAPSPRDAAPPLGDAAPSSRETAAVRREERLPESLL